MTIPTQLVLRALLDDPARELYGVEMGPRPACRAGQCIRSLRGWRVSDGCSPDGGHRSEGGGSARPPLLPADRRWGGVGPGGAGVGIPSGASAAVLARSGAAMTAPAADPWCCRVVELAAWLLPTEQRHRYALELIAELYGMPRSQQIRHSVHVLSHAWALRAALAEPARHQPRGCP